MAELPGKIDSRTLAFLASESPDVGVLFTGKPSKAADRDGLKAVAEARKFVAEHGRPSLERLGLADWGVLVLTNSQTPLEPGTLGAHIKRFRDGNVLVEGTLTATPPEQTFQALTDWAIRSPLRVVTFPYGDRAISMMLTNREAEETVRLKADLPLYIEAERVPLPEIRLEDCRLEVRTDKWNSPAGNPTWFAVQLSGDGVAAAGGGAPFNRRMVRFLEAVVAIGRNTPQLSGR